MNYESREIEVMKIKKMAPLRRTYFTQIDHRYDEMQERNEKSTHQKDWEENKIGLNDLKVERELKVEKKQQNNWCIKR